MLLISIHLNLIGGNDPPDALFDKGIVFFAQYAIFLQHHPRFFHFECGIAGFFCGGVDNFFHVE